MRLLRYGGESSRLYQSLVYRQQIAQEAFAQADLREDLGLFVFGAILTSDKKPEEAERSLLFELKRMALYELNLNQINSFIHNIQSVTPADIQKFASARIGAKNANIIIVGSAKEFLEPLRKQVSNVEVIPFAALDLNSASLRKTATASLSH